MRRKQPVRFQQKFPNVDPLAIRLLQRLLAFDPKDRPTAEEALADPYFKGLSKAEREPSSQPASKSDFDFEKKKLAKDDVRELIYREILEYHPEMLKQYLNNKDQPRYMYPSAVSQLRRQFDHLHRDSKEVVKPLLQRKPTSLPKERISEPKEGAAKKNVKENNCGAQCLTNKNTEKRAPLRPHKSIQESLNGHKMSLNSSEYDDATQKEISYVKKLVKSASVSLSHHTLTNTRTRSTSKVDPEDAKRDGATYDTRGVQPKSKSMGSTVAKMVAAFSNTKALP